MDHREFQDALDQFDLEDWMSQYVEVKKATGDERCICCPECGNNNYKVYVNIEKKRWQCKVCGWGEGKISILDFLASVSGRNKYDLYQEIVKSGTPSPVGDIVQQLESVFSASNKAIAEEPQEIEEIQLTNLCDFTGVIGSSILNYVYRRGLTKTDVLDYQLNCSTTLRGHTGPFLVFPIYYMDILVAYQGRRISNKEPRYVSSESIASWLWPLSTRYFDSVKAAGYVVLVEGVFDAAGFWRIGIPALCTFGKRLSHKQVQLLRDLGVRSVFLMWDEDATQTSVQRLRNGAKGLRGEVQNVAKRLKNHFEVRVVSWDNVPQSSNGKVDPGLLLLGDQNLETWFLGQLDKSVKVGSSDWISWQLGATF